MSIVDAVEIVTSTPKKPSNGGTLINIVLDETGSMNSCWDATINSFNEYIGSQKTVGGDCRVNLTTFSMQGGYGFAGAMGMMAARSINMTKVMDEARDSGKNVRNVFVNESVQAVAPLSRESYKPNGGTNLYDAIGSTIRNVETQLAPMASVPDVLIVIITDGEENASTEYRLEDIKALIKAKEQDGWTFVYLGANQDAWQVGQAFGLAKGQTMTYSTDVMGATMSKLADATTTYRSARSQAYAAAASAGGSYESTVAQDFFGEDGAEVK